MILKCDVSKTDFKLLAVFGVIWNHFHAKSTCLTIEDFRIGVDKAFKNSKLKIQFHDVLHQIGDWEKYLECCMDHNLRGGFKLDQTQQQCKDCHHYMFSI